MMMDDMFPFCHIHKTKMVPVSWYKTKGRITETDYACPVCIKERKEDEPIFLTPGTKTPHTRST